MNLDNVLAISIPEGPVKQIAINGSVIWQIPSAPTYEKYSWEGVFASIEAGTYATDYVIGDTVPLDLGSEGVIDMQIAAFDTDNLADGSGKAPITWVAKELLATKHRMSPTIASDVTTSVWGSGIAKNDGSIEFLTSIPSHLLYETPEITVAFTAKQDQDTTLSCWVGNKAESISVWLDGDVVVENYSSQSKYTKEIACNAGDTHVIRATCQINDYQAFFGLSNQYMFDFVVERSSHPQKPYTEGTGAIGGWEKSEMRAYLADTIMPLIPANVQKLIKLVTKESNSLDASMASTTQYTSDYLWIPSWQEVGGTSIRYNKLFSNNASRVRKLDSVGASWFVRSRYSTREKYANYFDGNDASGANAALLAPEQQGIVLCFCT